MDTRNCLYCGERLQTQKYPSNHNGRKYCSRKCYFDYIRSLRPPIPCEVCGTISQVQPSYAIHRKCCSSDCRRIRTIRIREQRKAAQIALDGEKESLVIIYVLLTARDRPIYVGRVRYGREKKRPYEHLRVGPCSHFQFLKLQPLETVPAEVWREKERWWMSYYTERGIRLLNRCAGGGGGSARDEGAVKDCPVCNKPFVITKGQVGRRKFCSKNCFYESMRQVVTQPCEHCGKAFVLTHKTQKRRFCSHRCHGLAFRKSIPIICPECQNTFMRGPFRLNRTKNPTCSRACRDKQMQKGLIQHNMPYGEASPVTKLTKEQAIYIIKMRGIKSLRSLAMEFETGKSTIWNIWTGRSWKYLSRPQFQLQDLDINNRIIKPSS